MSFPAYPAYRDSGVEWLGQVPAHWGVLRLRFITHVNPPKSEVAELPNETEVIFLPMKAIGERGELDLSRTRAIEEVRTGYSYLAEGDIIFAKVTPCLENGKGALATGLEGGLAFATTEVTVLRPANPEDGRFLWWLTSSQVFRKPAEGAMYGAGGLKRVADDWVKDFRVAWPPKDELAAIAAFLDRETGKIDALVEEQRRLIALLKEKRQALISHAVTRGLNPQAPLKPSGIEWLGDIPAHWDLLSIRHLCEILRGKFTHRPRNDPSFYDGEYPFIQTGDITGASRYITTYRQTLNERGAAVSKEFPSGTLVMAIAANLGDVAILTYNAYFPDSIVGLVPKSEVRLGYLYYLMIALKPALLNSATVSTQLNINAEQIAAITAIRPDLDEQDEIAENLDRELERYEELVAQAELGITLLQERRAALISAAVTGKIDVRGLVAAPGVLVAA